MATTYKVLDADGAKLVVKFTRGTDTTMSTVNWDGVTPIDAFLQNLFAPFPPVPPAVSVDTAQFIGKTGSLLRG